MKRKIVFVYNANSNKLSKCLDTIHKILSPSTYACDLCILTYGNFSEKEQWRNFRQQMQQYGYEFVFMYKNEFMQIYQHFENLPKWCPVVLEEKECGFENIILAEEFVLMSSIEKLINMLQLKLMNSDSFLY